MLGVDVIATSNTTSTFNMADINVTRENTCKYPGLNKNKDEQEDIRLSGA